MAAVKKILHILFFTAALIFIWAGFHMFYTAADGLHDDKRSADAAVVPGNQVYADGTLSKRLQKRVEHSAWLYREGRVKYIIVSGGRGKEGYDEGTAMKEYLAGQGIPENVIIADNKGVNTLATVKNTVKIMNDNNFKSIIAVSQYFHLPRIKMLFKKYGYRNICTSAPKYFELRDIYSLLREFPAYYKYKFQKAAKISGPGQ